MNVKAYAYVIKHKNQRLGRYATGQLRCQVCDIFMIWESLFCPCCGYRLRPRPRKMKYDIKIRIRKRTDEARRKFIALGHALTN